MFITFEHLFVYLENIIRLFKVYVIIVVIVSTVVACYSAARLQIMCGARGLWIVALARHILFDRVCNSCPSPGRRRVSTVIALYSVARLQIMAGKRGLWIDAMPYQILFECICEHFPARSSGS